jgi:Protein of unknown function (DUF3043)
VRVFRRSSAGATEGQAQDSQGTQAPEAPAKSKAPAQTGKGRPTPKRSEAEANRYRSLTGTTTSGRNRSSSTATPGRKLTPEEKDKARSQARSDRGRQMEAMRRGEEWALQPRDRGAAKKLVRDYVDSHRRPSEFYLYAVVIALFVSVGIKSAKGYSEYLLYAVILVIIVDMLFLRRSIKKLAAERLPGESTRGLALYAGMRTLQPRFMRNPRPRLKPGDSF